jgi:hypothetical protein
MSLAFDSWALACEASTVVALRLPKLATMDAAAGAEAQRMIMEKISAAASLQMAAFTGGLGRTPESAMRKSVGHYRKAVRKNRRRLSR